MLNSLDSVIATLDPSKAKPTSDFIYNGDISKWKKFGYSLLLRMAMRLTKVDMATAQQYAEKAYQEAHLQVMMIMLTSLSIMLMDTIMGIPPHCRFLKITAR